MANNEQANSFLEMMQGCNTDNDTDQKNNEPGLPVNPKVDNGQELNLVTSNWETRPLAGENNTDTELEINEARSIKPVLINLIRPVEKSKQRNFGLTDRQYSDLLQAAADFGFVRTAKGGEIVPNASAFLQKIIDLKIWESVNENEEGTNHE
ncbi:hypothetical protein [Lactococcus lactis]|uniref:hypothetical protein n=1 Tax=Lactococcus lactis TaxID=1358 RepID=UPI0015C36A53|nr:hypothetical protein [Lactococcus lactis]MCT0076686.1 hypothetical protein [Lactococcus lactis subsp. lactis]QLF89408.1 hypothetical protein HPC60_01175 [Lactococcus lactis subsp. lactis]